MNRVESTSSGKTDAKREPYHLWNLCVLRSWLARVNFAVSSSTPCADVRAHPGRGDRESKCLALQTPPRVFPRNVFFFCEEATLLSPYLLRELLRVFVIR